MIGRRILGVAPKPTPAKAPFPPMTDSSPSRDTNRCPRPCFVGGQRDENGDFPEGTLRHLVEEQLIGFAVIAKRFGDFFEVQGPDPAWT